MHVTKSRSKAQEICIRGIAFRLVLALLLTCAPGPAPALRAQQPAEPVPPQAESSSAKSASGPHASKHSDDFLVRGTVFTQEGLALPGAELHIRSGAERKPKWETVTNSRGNFAVRVKMGSDYEVVVSAKGFKDQSVSVNAKTGERFKDLVFRMEHQEGKKS